MAYDRRRRPTLLGGIIAAIAAYGLLWIIAEAAETLLR